MHVAILGRPAGLPQASRGSGYSRQRFAISFRRAGVVMAKRAESRKTSSSAFSPAVQITARFLSEGVRSRSPPPTRPVGAAGRSAVDHHPVFVHGPIEESVEGADGTDTPRLAEAGALSLTSTPVSRDDTLATWRRRGEGHRLALSPMLADKPRRPSSPSSAGRRGNPRPPAPPWRRAGTPFRRLQPCGLRPGLHQLQQRP